jgi:hypothetical protein
MSENTESKMVFNFELFNRQKNITVYNIDNLFKIGVFIGITTFACHMTAKWVPDKYIITKHLMKNSGMLSSTIFCWYLTYRILNAEVEQ